MKKSIFIVMLCIALALTGLFMFGCETGETSSSTGETSSSTGENVNAYITATLDDMATTWGELENDYDLTAYLDRYTAIKTAVENAETKESVDEQKTLFDELADEIVKNAKPKNPDPTPEEIAETKTAAEKRWEDIMADYDGLVDLQNYSEQYAAFMAEFATVKTAAELSSLIERLNTFFDSVCEYCGNQPIQQEYKELIAANMQSRWDEYLTDYPDLADTEYKTQIDALIAGMQSAEYIKDAEDIYADFTDWVNDVENNYLIDRFRAAAVSQIEEKLKSITSKYPDAKDDAALKSIYDKALSDLQKATMRDEIDNIINDFIVSTMDWEDRYKQALFDNAVVKALNEVQSNIDVINFVYGDKITEAQKNEITRLLKLIKTSGTMEELNANKKAALDYINAVAGEIKAADSEEVKAAKQNLLSKM